MYWNDDILFPSLTTAVDDGDDCFQYIGQLRDDNIQFSYHINPFLLYVFCLQVIVVEMENFR